MASRRGAPFREWNRNELAATSPTNSYSICAKKFTHACGLERALASGGWRILGTSVVLSSMGGVLGRIAAMIPGFSTLFVIALPIGLVTEAVERI
ncbi:MAG TPA: hypothetical protein VEJ46_14075 [Candidatus Acidoferrum sp.]|nr:hypothetical protein [Candidatus Acidoferrum sp.]